MAEILLAIPVYNEARHVSRVLARARAFIGDILVVDDGSDDGTSARLDAERGIYRVTHSENLGYGQSLISAFRFAASRGYDWVITMDCDEQHEPSHIPQFIEAIREDDADIISGSRYLAAFPENDAPPAERRRINETVSILVNRVLGLSLTDAFCGFKAHRVLAMISLDLSIPGYAFPLQLWARAARAGLRIREIPVPLIYNDPNRHFGGMLDDSSVRLEHYLDVLAAELAEPAVDPNASVCCLLKSC
jgi:dolichol-phosphate mannosyltransferase